MNSLYRIRQCLPETNFLQYCFPSAPKLNHQARNCQVMKMIIIRGTHILKVFLIKTSKPSRWSVFPKRQNIVRNRSSLSSRNSLLYTYNHAAIVRYANRIAVFRTDSTHLCISRSTLYTGITNENVVYICPRTPFLISQLHPLHIILYAFHQVPAAL